MLKTAVINGVTGQDGFYMAKHLLSRGYEVTGIVRNLDRVNSSNNSLTRVKCIEWNMKNCDDIKNIISSTDSTEFYNFAAYSSGEGMFNNPIGIGEINGIAVARILEAIREVKPTMKFCQASSREIFRVAIESPQTE